MPDFVATFDVACVVPAFQTLTFMQGNSKQVIVHGCLFFDWGARVADRHRLGEQRRRVFFRFFQINFLKEIELPLVFTTTLWGIPPSYVETEHRWEFRQMSFHHGIDIIFAVTAKKASNFPIAEIIIDRRLQIIGIGNIQRDVHENFFIVYQLVALWTLYKFSIFPNENRALRADLLHFVCRETIRVEIILYA